MLLQLLHPQERFLIFCQHAQDWIFGVWVKLRKYYVALLVLVLNLEEDQSAVVLVVHQALEVVSAVHCQERNEINNHRNGDRDWPTGKVSSSSFFYLHRSLLPELEINSSTSQTSLLKKVIYLADHLPEKNSDEYTESILWFYLFCDRVIARTKLVRICCITNPFVSTPESSTFFGLLPSKTAKAR